jgi:hypothetical protein
MKARSLVEFANAKGGGFYAGGLFFLLFLLLISFLLLYSRISDHKITIKRVQLGLLTFSIFEVGYERHSTESHFACSKTMLHLHLPRPSAPYWGTFTVCDMEYIDSDCHISASQLDAKLWFFPLFFRFTAGPWITVQLDDLRIRVFSSSDTPYYIKAMRQDLIAAISKGEILRLDDFKLDCNLGGLSKAMLGDYEADKGVEEVRISVSGTQCHIVTAERRYYTFPDVVAQLRRNWVRDNGTFVMIAKNSKWSRIHSPYQRYAFSAFS